MPCLDFGQVTKRAGPLPGIALQQPLPAGAAPRPRPRGTADGPARPVAAGHGAPAPQPAGSVPSSANRRGGRPAAGCCRPRCRRRFGKDIGIASVEDPHHARTHPDRHATCDRALGMEWRGCREMQAPGERGCERSAAKAPGMVRSRRYPAVARTSDQGFRLSRPVSSGARPLAPKGWRLAASLNPDLRSLRHVARAAGCVKVSGPRGVPQVRRLGILRAGPRQKENL